MHSNYGVSASISLCVYIIWTSFVGVLVELFFPLWCRLKDAILNIPNSLLSPPLCRSASCECEMCVSKKANGGATDAKQNRMKSVVLNERNCERSARFKTAYSTGSLSQQHEVTSLFGVRKKVSLIGGKKQFEYLQHDKDIKGALDEGTAQE